MNKILLTCYLVFALCGLTACSGTEQAQMNKVQIPPVSVQLWSVKDAIEKDFKGTLRQLADMGFQGVEFAGNYGEFSNNPQGLKDYLNSLGLKASGAHVGFDGLRGEKLAKTLDFLKALEIEMVIVPMDSRAWSPDGVESLVAELTELSNQLAKKGMLIGYHNHDREFDPYQNLTFWDYIAKNTPQNVLLQLDVGWVNFADKDAVEYVKRYAGRTLATHIKIRNYHGPDRTPQGASPIIGEDQYDWASLIKTQAAVGGTRWLVLEQEEYPDGLSSMQAVKQSKLGLDKIISTL
ncbi:sugar phosphate isomerase/epimerase family protein [Paraglaciecola arctica]|uniref:sugar phosphate isomerase/epimerase family protein n=1 Tax=Paraglaciecola arctica TaxID=1128911 RepID=UPI001C07D40D|nr:sugar phosphate isomerase/epimerase [Paraglaciecola arctica]MBU3006199.1 sugar phosphate isomerase/epimerase [Paraglaciecola arctica]